VDIAKQICLLEKDHLRQYFVTSYPDRTHLLASLENVLDLLPERLAASLEQYGSYRGDSNHEESSEERVLLARIACLEAEVTALAEYESNIHEFMRDSGLSDNSVEKSIAVSGEGTDDDKVCSCP
jgi:hypothetical protein